MVQSALRQTANAEKIAQMWADHNSTKATTSDDVKRARDWIKVNVRFDNTPLERVLNQIWAASYVFGAQDATNEVTSTVGFDWDNWVPGNMAAAALVNPPTELKNMLNKSKKHAQQLSDTTADRIATQLALGLDQGFGPQEIARNINQELDNPARSLVIARTETADALVQANLETYREAEVELIEWLVGDPCDDCAQNAGVQVRIGGVFPSGDEAPPAHPNCVCDVAPIVLTMDEMQNSDAFDLAAQPDLVKYNEDQPRDDRGRFTSAGGDEENAELTDFAMAQTFSEMHNAYVDAHPEAAYLRSPDVVLKAAVAEKIADKLKDLPIEQFVGDKSEDYLNAPAFISVNTFGADILDVLSDDKLTFIRDVNNPTQITALSDEALAQGMFPPAGESEWAYATNKDEKEAMIREATAASLVGKWAVSSNDQNGATLAMQQIAAEHFGLEGTVDWPMDSGVAADVDFYTEFHGELLTSFLDAQYQTTQELFKELELDEITVYRGLEIQGLETGEQEVSMRPLSSWSTDVATALQFAGQEGNVLTTTFPASMIFSTPVSGFGCMSEKELVVLGGTIKADVQENGFTGSDEEIAALLGLE